MPNVRLVAALRAAIYLRISRDVTGENLGVNRQLEDCRNLAKTLDWTVTEIYTDNDVSASSGKTRPGYKQMMADVETGLIDSIIAWHPDRLYRRAVDLGPLVDICKKHNTQIATVRAGTIDLTTPTGRLVAGLLAQVATYEGEAKSDRWKRSIRQRRESGTVHTMGPRLYGYERDGTIIGHEREHLEWAAGQILDGAALVRTTWNLNERGSRTSLGNQWNRAGLKTTLTNPRLAGMSTLNGDVVGVGQWAPIFDAETHEAIVAAFAVRAGARPRQPRLSLLLGLAKCGKCGQTLKGSRRYPGNGAPSIRTYRCDKLPGTNQGCGGVSVRAEPLEQMVEAYAQELAQRPEVQAHIDALRATTGSKAGEALALEQRIRELETQLSEPGVPVQAILRAIDRSKEHLEKIRAAEVEATPAFHAGAEWPTDLARRARMVRTFVAEVIVNPVENGNGTFNADRIQIVPRIELD